MFFFKSKEKCNVCSIKDTRTKLSDGYICSNCKTLVYQSGIDSLKDLTVIKAQEAVEKRNLELDKIKKFKSDLKIDSNPIVEFDNTQEVMVIKNNLLALTILIDYKDILSFEIIEDGESVVKSNGLGRAVVGGILFAGVGAVVGAVTGSKKTKALINNLQIRMITRTERTPFKEIIFIKKETKKNSGTYKTALKECNKLGAKLTQIIDSQNS